MLLPSQSHLPSFAAAPTMQAPPLSQVEGQHSGCHLTRLVMSGSRGRHSAWQRAVDCAWASALQAVHMPQLCWASCMHACSCCRGKAAMLFVDTTAYAIDSGRYD